MPTSASSPGNDINIRIKTKPADSDALATCRLLHPPAAPSSTMEVEPTSLKADFQRLSVYIDRYNPTCLEWLKVARMYCFGSPIRRRAEEHPNATPGCVRVELWAERLPASVARLDTIDIPLEPNGDVNLRHIRQWWGVQCEPVSWDIKEVFYPANDDRLSALALYNLSDGRNKLRMFYWREPGDAFSVENLGTWQHQLQYTRRAFAGCPSWYGNRLFVFCLVLCWLMAALPNAWAALASCFHLVSVSMLSSF